jgi:hypothetical protein
MPDPIRLDIINAMKTLIGTVTTSNGYRNTITTVEVLAKDYGHPTVTPASLSWCGIVPMKEVIQDQPFGLNIVNWAFQIIVHFEFSTRTDLGLATACAEHTNDIRKVLYGTPQLGVDGVHMIKIVGRQGSEGSCEAARKGRGSILLDAVVRFREDVSDA